MKSKHIAIALLALATLRSQTSAAPLNTAFSYQGRLNISGKPAEGLYELRFAVFDAASDGTRIGSAITNSAPVTSGLFAVTLEFGGIFDGNARWLEIGVRTNGSAEDFALLNPRQPLTPAPYALYAPTAGTASSANTAAIVGADAVANTGLQANAVTTDKILDGSIGISDLNSSLRSNTFWSLQGNVGNSSAAFLGTADDKPLKLRVNSYVGWRLEPAWFYPNIIGGQENNKIATYATVIGGGGNNSVASNAQYSVIGAGSNNSIGTNSYYSVIAGGGGNSVGNDAPWSSIHGGGYNSLGHGAHESTIGGGYLNKLGTNAFASTIAGGYQCAVGDGASTSTIGGGYDNHVLDGAYGSTIGGGHHNTNGGRWSVVPGGAGNAAMGNNSFAAGSSAKALHVGAFVWADHQGDEFASTANNQFLVRADGGVGINKPNPNSALDVNGTVTASEFNAYGPVQLNDTDIYFRSFDTFHGLGWFGNPRYFGGINVNGPVLYGFGGGALGYTGNGTNVALLWNASGRVGIGKLNPATALDVNGAVTATSFLGSGTNLYLGTADNQPLDLVINNQPGLRLEPGGSNSVNVVGGWHGNLIGAGVIGATISGGGSMKLGDDRSRINQVFADFGTVAGGAAHYIDTACDDSSIGGGFRNGIGGSRHATISGGYGNTITFYGDGSVIGGGWVNTILSPNAMIGGGYINQIEKNSYGATISGGVNNIIRSNADYAVIGGGLGNEIQTNAQAATIPGGYYNSAAGFAFAAGSYAKADHVGTFVWADHSSGAFSSTASNQFLIRAGGGVGVNKTAPATALDVNGTVTASGLNLSGPARLSDNNIFFRGDNNHGLGWYGASKPFGQATPDGPVLFGYSGGGLGSFRSGVATNLALSWDSGGGVNVAGSLNVNGGLTTANSVRVSDQQIFLRSNSDTLHGLGWYASGTFAGWNPDGPVLYGCGGGALGATCSGQVIALAWNNEGRVGMGRSSALNRLEVEGNASKTTSGSWLANSDARIKTGIETITNAIETLSRVRPVSFHYTDQYRAAHPSIEDQAYVNVIAQEFREVFPNAVKPSGETLPDGSQILQVDTYPLTVYSAAAVRELNEKLEHQRAQIDDLTQTVNELKTLLAKLARKMD